MRWYPDTLQFCKICCQISKLFASVDNTASSIIHGLEQGPTPVRLPQCLCTCEKCGTAQRKSVFQFISHIGKQCAFKCNSQVNDLIFRQVSTIRLVEAL